MKPNRSLFNPALSLLLGALLSPCAQAQPAFTELISLEARPEGQFGDRFGGLPDLTRDGVGEFYVFGSNRAYVYDGVTVDLLQSFSAAGCAIGRPAYSPGDVNGDGIPDLMLTKNCGTSLVGAVDVVDSATGGLLFTLESPNPVTQGFFGRTVRVWPDMTGDEKEDWLIHQQESQSRAGRVYVFDSQTRQAVRTIQNTEAAYRFWMESVEVIPDVDQDGKPELIVASGGASVSRGGQTLSNAGRVVVLSLQNGQVLYELHDPEPEAQGFFGSLSGIGDVTGDGIGDIAVGDYGADEAGAIHFFSGTDGKWLRTLRAPSPQLRGRFGARIKALPDLNGDGVLELLTQEQGAARAYLYDGATSTLLKTIEYPGSPGQAFVIGAVRQQAPPGIRAYLFVARNAGISNEGRVYYMPITPLQPTRLRPMARTASGFTLQVTGEPGLNLEIKSSNDFRMWEPVATVTTGTEPVETEDSTAASQPQRFYRAVQRE